MINKDRKIEIVMAVCLLIGAFFLFACGTKYSTQENVNETNESVEESSSEESLQLEKDDTLAEYTVVLDAGHGASDSGKVGGNGAYEKDINLSIVLLLRQELEAKGAKVVLTRESDEPLYTSSDSNKKMADMKKRIAIITESKADIAVSIHQNSYPDESVKGPQVFYYTASTEGEKLAVAIQDSFSLAVGEENNRRLAKANSEYYLLLHTPCVCVIAECGFLSNYEEAEILITKEYQEKMAKAVAQGITNYLLQTKE